MELRQLQCMVACAQTKSFSKAAALLFMTQSNVSKTIAALEKELGRTLFERKQHGIELTEKGRQVYKYALSMMEYSEKIMDCVEEESAEELRISFQPSSWFASAFCDFYIRNGGEGKRFHMISAAVDEIIRRLSNDLDQMGYAYIEENQLEKLQDVFQANHIGYYVLEKTRTVLYFGNETNQKQENGKRAKVLPLIQGPEDYYSGLYSWKEKKNEEEEEKRKLRVVISTNSDYIMQEILRRTELGNISPEYLSHKEKSLSRNIMPLENEENNICFICMFRNDRGLEPLPKRFLGFIKNYLKE